MHAEIPRRKIKIMYIQPNCEIGGSDNALLRMISALDKENYTPIAVVPSDGPMIAPLKQAGAEVHMLPMRQLRTIPSVSYQFSYLKEFWPTVRSLVKLMKEQSVDIVHTNSLYSIYGAWAAKIAHIPHIWHVREIPPKIPIARTIYAMMVDKLSDAVIVMTKACAEGLFGKRKTPPSVVLMADGLDLNKWSDKIKGDRIRKELGFGRNDKVIGFVARLDPWKGLDVFIKAAEKIHDKYPNVKFIVVGGAPSGFEQYEKEMKELAESRNLGDSMRFLGWRYRLDDIPEIMASIDIFSHTSTEPEPFGLVLIEAMSIGKPVIAAAAGGPLEIVENGVSGYLTEPGNSEEHARVACELLGDSEKRLIIGRSARKRVEDRYSEKVSVERLHDLYRKIIASMRKVEGEDVLH